MNQAKKGKKLSKFLYLFFWLILITATLGLTISQSSRYNTLRNELDRVQENLRREQEAYELLLEQEVYYESDAYIEQLARDWLGLVRPDEIVFINEQD